MKYKSHAIFVTLYLILLLTGCSNKSEPNENIEIIESENTPLSSDLILYNAKVYSLNWQEPSLLGKPAQDAPHDLNGWHPDAQAIVLLKDKIIYVGSNQEALQYKTKLILLDKKFHFFTHYI